MTIRRLISSCRGLRGDERGVSAVEFALILPVMVAIFLGSVELSQAITLKRKVTLVASSIADLIAREEELSEDEVTAIMDAAQAIMTPYQVELTIIMSSVGIDKDDVATVDWSRALDEDDAHTAGEAIYIPETMRTDALRTGQTYMVKGEVSYDHTPIFGDAIIGEITLSDTFYLTPRQSAKVVITDATP